MMKQLLAFPKKYEVTGKITKDRFLNSGNLTDAEKKVLELYLKNINILYDIRFLDQSEMIVLEIELTDAERGKYGLSNLVKAIAQSIPYLCMLLVRTEGVIRFFTFDRKENEFDDSRSRVRDICSSQDIMFSDGHESKVKDNPLNENFAKKEFQALWREINHKYAYTVEFDSDELIKKSIEHINDKLFISELQYTTTIGRQKSEINEYELSRGDSFVRESSGTYTLKHAEVSQIKYDLIGKIAEATTLTRKTISKILQGIRIDKLYMFQNNPEEFITKVSRLINEQKATMIVEHISYDTIEGEYDSTIFTAEKNTQSFEKAFLAKKAIQDYVFTDGVAEKSIERKFAEDLDAAEEVCVYAKLPRTFQIPTPVGNYSPDWAIAFYEGKVKHIFFVAETKGTMESLELRPIEQAKISCAKKLFNEMSTSKVRYHDVDSYQSLLNVMNSIK